MTKEQAGHLATLDETYRARKMRGQWVVWCDASDHVVEFPDNMIEASARWKHLRD